MDRATVLQRVRRRSFFTEILLQVTDHVSGRPFLRITTSLLLFPLCEAVLRAGRPPVHLALNGDICYLRTDGTEVMPVCAADMVA